jgi:hypothetical protein
MSGSRHARMNAIRIRKENQVSHLWLHTTYPHILHTHRICLLGRVM